MSASVQYEYQLRNPEPEIREFSFGVPNQPDVTVMKDGSFLATFDLTFGQDMVAINYDQGGERIGNEHVLIDSTSNDAASDSHVAGLTAGDAVVVWTDKSGTTPEVRAMLLDKHGAPVENVGIGTGSNDSFGDVAALKDGGFVVSYQHKFLKADGTADNDIKAEIHNADGSLRATVTVDASTVNDHNATVAALSNGGFVETFARDEADGSSSTFFRVFDANGVAKTGVTLIDDRGTVNLETSVTALKDGGFAVAYVTNGEIPGSFDVGMKTFNADGSVRTDFTLLNEGATAGGQVDPSLTVLQNGFIMASWTNLDGQSTSISVVDEQGNLVLPPQTIFGSQDHVTETVLQALSNGDVVAIGTGHGSFDQTVIEGQLGHIIRETFGDQTSEVLTGDALEDFIVGNGGNDSLSGLGGHDALDGGSGNDTLNGGSGDDDMTGGSGDDTFIVNSAGDEVDEAANGGNDRVATSVSYVLDSSAHVELLTTTNSAGTSAINLTGNFLDNIIIGNAGNNVIDGGFGADSMGGLGGNDTYVVNDAGDTVSEAANSGTDRVQSSISFTLGDNVENLTLTGTKAINGTGNGLANHLSGNGASNVLDGGAGIDSMSGGAGDDTYIVDNAKDVVIEVADGGANDVVAAKVDYTLGASAHVEQLRTTSSAGTASIDLTGNGFANQIVGNAGANVLDGAGGADKLIGGLGKDIFVFDTALGGGNVDAILDFKVADDTIRLENAVFKGLAAGELSPNEFFVGKAAHDADDHVIYDEANGKLFFDADGTGAGAQVEFATVTAGLDLTHADFVVT